MPKKRKLNSTNPKYWSEDKKIEPEVLERRVISKKNSKVSVYAVFVA
tara:strand:+ start:4823 stop:4963 length:141 start_codon:yes stop_codon:yes gene_type:complete